MAKLKLEFDYYEEKEEFEDALNGTKHRLIIDEIWQEVFRPYYKHGYSNEQIENLIIENEEVVEKLMDYLSARYHQVLKDNNYE